jgi:hypothetical protein
MFHRQCIHPAEFEVPIFQCVFKLYGFEDDIIGDLLRIGRAGYFGLNRQASLHDPALLRNLSESSSKLLPMPSAWTLLQVAEVRQC